MMTFSERLGNEIFKRMSDKEITCEDMANKLELSCNDVLRICCGQLILPPYMIERIANVLGTTKKELINISLKGDWISVKEKLPKESCYVLACYDDETAIPEIMHFNNLYGYEGFHSAYTDTIFDNIVAWMPLPEKYKG